MTPEKYCKEIVKESGSNFYYSFLFLPRRKRRAIYAVYAFSRVIDDIVDGDENLSTKEKMLAFWRSEIDQCYGGHSEHLLTKELIHATSEFNIPRDYLIELMMGVTQDMIQSRYATFEDLKKYCYRVASVVGLICLRIFEVENTVENRDAAVNLGLAFQVTNILRDVAADADRDRIYLPEEDLLRFNLTEADILNRDYSGGFIDLMSFEWYRARDFYRKALNGFDEKASKKLLPAMIMADIYYEVLLKIKEAKFNVFEQRIRIPNSQKVRMALKRWVFGGNKIGPDIENN